MNPCAAETTWKHPDKVRLNALPGRRALRRAFVHPASTSEPLAPPPVGSGLTAVPGDGGLPGLGRSLEALLDGPVFTQRRYDTYGPVSWSRAFGITMVSALGPEATQAVLVNRDKAFSQSGWEWFIGRFFQRGLMLLDFDEHRFHRRIMQQAFTPDRLAGYLSRVDELVRADVAAWPAAGQVFVYPSVKQMSLQVATDVFMGGDAGDQTAALHRAFTDTVRAGTAIVRHPLPGNKWKRGLDGRRVLEEFFRGRIPAARASDGDDLFSALCHARTDEGDTFTDDDVVSHMIFLMMAAHDTTTTTSSSVLGQLAAHPEWQERVRAQSLALSGDLTAAGLDTLTDLDLVLKEALRLVAPVPSLARRTVKDTELLGRFIPKGTFIGISPWFNHYVPEIWKDPTTFDPERFADPRTEDQQHPFAWVPFGGGVHKCIGMGFGTMEVKTIVHHLLRRYQLSVPPGYRTSWDLTSLPVPADGMPVQLTPL